MGNYVPSTKAEQEEMLAAIGCKTFDQLFEGLPSKVRLNAPLHLPSGCSQMETERQLTKLAKENRVFRHMFRGAGAYRHYIPAPVRQITAKEEFVTAYTPYQAEISQGVLQGIFEYQTMICMLTGMAVSNASVYDGATAAAEAMAMCREGKRKVTLVSATTNPRVIETMRTYCFGADTELVTVPEKDGVTDQAALRSLLKDTTACFYLQQPNYYGSLEDAGTLGQMVHEAGAKFIMGCNPISLGMLKTPGESGADIAVGEGQPLGMPLSFGGPYLGFMATTEKMMRKLPGRIVGETTDAAGERAFVLTLQAREQHIRREKASSNICSNQALCALTAAVYLAAVGPEGLAQVASLCYAKAHYAAAQIGALPGFDLVNKSPFFHEFVTRCPIAPEVVLERLAEEEILGGLPLEGEREGQILWCVTEENTKEEIDLLVMRLREVAGR